MLNNFNFADKSIKPEDLAANAFGYYCDDFSKLTDILTLKNNIYIPIVVKIIGKI